MKPKIKLAIPDHPRTRAFLDGTIQIEGYDLEITHDFPGRAGERHHRFVQGESDCQIECKKELSSVPHLRTIVALQSASDFVHQVWCIEFSKAHLGHHQRLPDQAGRVELRFESPRGSGS